MYKAVVSVQPGDAARGILQAYDCHDAELVEPARNRGRPACSGRAFLRSVIPAQNKNRKPICPSRGVSRVVLIVPNVELPNVVAGLPKWSRLNRLKMSMRISAVVRPIAVRFAAETSVLNTDGPRTLPIR